MFINKGTFTQAGGNSKTPGASRNSINPGISISQVRNMLASQGGDKLSREVSEEEEKSMMNIIWNNKNGRR